MRVLNRHQYFAELNPKVTPLERRWVREIAGDEIEDVYSIIKACGTISITSKLARVSNTKMALTIEGRAINLEYY